MSRTGGNAWRSWAQNAGLVVLGLALGLVILEASLQLAALVIGRVMTPDTTGPGWGSGRRRVLSLGDSNTFGLYVDRQQAYPKVFERLWNAQAGRPYEITVLNLGFPGMNSSRARADIARLLRTLSPDIVTVMIGGNDVWTRPVPLEDRPHGIGDSLWRASRVYRLFFMLGRSLRSSELEVSVDALQGFERGSGVARYAGEEFQLGWEQAPRGGVPNWRFQLVENLNAVIEVVRHFGARPILLTYPSEWKAYGAANAVMREVAAGSRIPLVDVATAFRPLCPEGRCPQLYADQHPTVSGHEITGEALLGAMLRVSR